MIHYPDRQLGSIVVGALDALFRQQRRARGGFRARATLLQLGSRWAGGVSLLDDQRVDSRYDLGDRRPFETHEKYSTIYWGRSAGLVDGWARRLSIGLTYEEHAFGAAPGFDAPLLLPSDRTLVYPWIGVEWVEDAFDTARNRNQIEKTEDYSLGWHARAQLASPRNRSAPTAMQSCSRAGCRKGCR